MCNLMQPALNTLKSQKKRHLALPFLKDHIQLVCISKQLQHLSEEDTGICLVSAYFSEECLANYGDDQHFKKLPCYEPISPCHTLQRPQTHIQWDLNLNMH